MLTVLSRCAAVPWWLLACFCVASCVPAAAVSRSEGGQQKHLLVLDGEWRPVGEIPIDVGPRHYTLSGSQPAMPPSARKGDR